MAERLGLEATPIDRGDTERVFMYEIIKGLPSIAGGKRGRKWPWAEMEVGDSVFIPVTDFEAAKNSANAVAYRGGKRFARRKVDEETWLFQRTI